MEKAKTIPIKKPSVWRNFVHFIRQIRLPWILIAAAFALNIGRAVIGLVLPEKMAAITDYELAGGSDIVRIVVGICLTIFALAAVNFVISLIATYITYIAQAKINRDFQVVASRKVFSLKAKDIEARDPKEFISRITTDTSFVSEFLIDLLVNEIPRLYFIISTILKVSRMGNGTLVLSFLIVIPVIILGSFWSGQVAYRTQNRLQRSIAVLTAKLAEKVNNIEIIKAYNKTEDEITSGDVFIDEMKKSQKKTTWAAALNTLVSNILFIIPTLIIMVAGATQLLGGSITNPQFIEFFVLGGTYQTYIAAHLTLWVLAKKAQGATLRLSEVMTLEEDQGGTEEAGKEGELAFKNVSFSYGTQPVLSDVSFEIPSGSKVAIVGRSGSGKSTILNLIEQFYRPESGTITLDGVDITSYEIKSYRNLFSYLPQNAPGFSGTVREMLTYASAGEHTDEELEKVLAEVGMTEAVTFLGGLDYEVGPNASRLSGGQRQRLAIARMLMKDAKMVLMDEATSALDVAGAAEMAKLIDRYAAGKTRVIVAHDLSTIEDADRIIVLDKGRVVDQGTQEELKARCLLYQELVNSGKEEQ